MSDQWGNRQQPSNRDPGRIRAEHVFLIVAAVSLSAAIVAYVLDSALPIELNRGAYSIMATLAIMGFCGWLSRSAERRHRRVAYSELSRLAAAVEELRAEVEQLRQQDAGEPVAPEAEAALRRIGMKLLNGSNGTH